MGLRVKVVAEILMVLEIDKVTAIMIIILALEITIVILIVAICTKRTDSNSDYNT